LIKSQSMERGDGSTGKPNISTARQRFMGIHCLRCPIEPLKRSHTVGDHPLRSMARRYKIPFRRGSSGRLRQVPGMTLSLLVLVMPRSIHRSPGPACSAHQPSGRPPSSGWGQSDGEGSRQRLRCHRSCRVSKELPRPVFGITENEGDRFGTGVNGLGNVIPLCRAHRGTSN
jgi:hypothetical protein